MAFRFFNVGNKDYNTIPDIVETKSSFPSNNSFKDIPPVKSFPQADSDEVFEIFGIKLYLDDLIILGIMWVLYSEGVKDMELFMFLFLLLMS
ncbi:MAG: hypothetical protein LBL91_00870 [Lachnospiraceae bacterium]|jgi:hypothetical protein|nr:hypothetical protein [Lachnospiraceae bacterium]